MGLFSGRQIVKQEERATYYAPTVPAVIGSYADVLVTATTAAQSIAVRSTADLIASLGSELPLDVYVEERGRKREVKTPTALGDPGGDGRGREDWGYRLLWSWLLCGNILGDVIDQKGGLLQTVDLINMDDVTVTVVDGAPKWYVRGREIPGERVKHWRVNPIAGRLLGLSPIEHHATTIGVSLASSRFGRQWFQDGAHPSGALTNSEQILTPEQIADAKAKVAAARGTNDPFVLGKGWGWQNVQISPEESQFLQTAGMSEAQCARIFGPGFAEILGYETGKAMTYDNIVDRRQDLLVLSMNRWLRRYERVLSQFTPPGQKVELNRDALLESTTLQRYKAHASALRYQWRTPNEIRAIENLDEVPWGDKPIQVTSSQGADDDDSNA